MMGPTHLTRSRRRCSSTLPCVCMQFVGDCHAVLCVNEVADLPIGIHMVRGDIFAIALSTYSNASYTTLACPSYIKLTVMA